jgi:hypothetical protein
MRCLASGQLRNLAMQEQRRLVEQPLGALHALQHDALGAPPQLALLVGRQFTAGEHHDRHVAQALVGLDLAEQVEAGDVRQFQVEDGAVELARAQQFQRFLAAAGLGDLDVVAADQRLDAELLAFIVLDDQQLAHARLDEGVHAVEHAARPSVEFGLVMNENAPRSRPYWRSSSTVSTCTGMWRVAGSCLSWLSTVQPSMSGRNTSSVTAASSNLRASDKRSAPSWPPAP